MVFKHHFDCLDVVFSIILQISFLRLMTYNFKLKNLKQFYNNYKSKLNKVIVNGL